MVWGAGCMGAGYRGAGWGCTAAARQPRRAAAIVVTRRLAAAPLIGPCSTSGPGALHALARWAPHPWEKASAPLPKAAAHRSRHVHCRSAAPRVSVLRKARREVVALLRVAWRAQPCCCFKKLCSTKPAVELPPQRLPLQKNRSWGPDCAANTIGWHAGRSKCAPAAFSQLLSTLNSTDQETGARNWRRVRTWPFGHRPGRLLPRRGQLQPMISWQLVVKVLTALLEVSTLASPWGWPAQPVIRV
jgi:hypothetical protein